MSSACRSTTASSLPATGGGGGTLTANVRAPGANEQFTLVRTVGSGTIVNGDTVALKSADNKHYVTVVSGSVVDVSATSIGAVGIRRVNERADGASLAQASANSLISAVYDAANGVRR